jgi:hypothetical protein
LPEKVREDGAVPQFDWKSLLLAIPVAMIGLWVLQPGASGGVEGRVADLAARMRAVTPQPMGDGSILRSVRAEGRTVVFEIDGAGAGGGGGGVVGEGPTERTQAEELCAQPDARALIAAGAQFRIERRIATGGTLPALVVDRC